MSRFTETPCFLTAVLLCLTCNIGAAGSTNGIQTLRIVTYNIEDDINGATTPLPGLSGVLEGIGEEILAGDPAQPLDILALQETTSNPTTVAPIVNGLNLSYNNPAMYAMSPYQATEEGGDTADGNGPNSIVYNTTTLQLVASVPVDPAGGTSQLGPSSGEYREAMRYEFAPMGVAPSPTNEFYVYVSHYKSGTTSADLTDRHGEAQIIRNDEATNLPSNARVLYVGDYNITTSGEASYLTILATNSPSGVAQGQGIDPLNVAQATTINWGTNSQLSVKTESATDLRYRDDLEVMTTNVYYGAPGGLTLVPGTYHTFGNNGTTPYQGSVNSGSDTALNNDLESNPPISASSLYADLSTASDHLPIVADYTIPVPTGFLAWQIQYFGSVTNPAAAPNFDADGTGQSNYFKYVAGLNPTNSSSVFTFTATGAGDLVLAPVEAGRAYTLEVKTNLSDAVWTPLSGSITTTNGSQVTITDTNVPSQQMFYRIDISLQ